MGNLESSRQRLGRMTGIPPSGCGPDGGNRVGGLGRQAGAEPLRGQLNCQIQPDRHRRLIRAMQTAVASQKRCKRLGRRLRGMLRGSGDGLVDHLLWHGRVEELAA
jgi:hypothetical protein